MNVFFLLFLFYVSVRTAPVKEETIKNGTKINTSEANELVGESRAGLVDSLNPFNNNSPTSDKNKDNEENNNPLSGIPNLFNISNNPLAQLFSSSSNGNFLNDVKVFVVGSQGMVFPASAILGGFQNFMQAMGNLGNLAQGAQNLIPSLPGS